LEFSLLACLMIGFFPPFSASKYSTFGFCFPVRAGNYLWNTASWCKIATCSEETSKGNGW